MTDIQKNLPNHQENFEEKIIPKSPVVPSGFTVKFWDGYNSVELLKGSNQLIYIEDNDVRFSGNEIHIDAVEAVLYAYKFGKRPTHKDDENLKPWELEAIKAGWVPPKK